MDDTISMIKLLFLQMLSVCTAYLSTNVATYLTKIFPPAATYNFWPSGLTSIAYTLEDIHTNTWHTFAF